MEVLFEFFNSFRFASPFVAFGLLPVLAFFLWLALRKKKAQAHSHLEFLGRERISKKIRQKLFLVLPFLALVSILIGIAGPQIVEEIAEPLEARDIIVVLDGSGSMMVGFYPDPEDSLPKFERTRLGVAVEILREFIKMREGDRIAIILYDDPRGYVARGFTDDQEQLLSVFNKEEIEGIYERVTNSHSLNYYAVHRGTNTPMGLKLARDFFEKESEAKEKLIVLVTDLDDDPLEVPRALEETRESGIRIYTIGIVQDYYHHRLARLRELFKDEGLRFFCVEDKEDLLFAFRAIDQMEKSVVETNTVVAVKSLSWIFIISALSFALIFIVISEKFKKVP